MSLAEVRDISGKQLVPESLPRRTALAVGYAIATAIRATAWVAASLYEMLFASIGWLIGRAWMGLDFGFRHGAGIPQRVPEAEEPTPEG